MLERAAYMASALGGREVEVSHMPLVTGGVGPTAGSARGPVFEPGKSYRQTRAEWEASFEKSYVAWLLGRFDGNISAAARAAEMDRKYLHKLAKKHGLHPSDGGS